MRGHGPCLRDAEWLGCITRERAALAQPHAGEPPVTTVVGADGLWHNHDVRLTFLALDDSGSVAGIQIRVDNGTMIDVPAAKYQMTLAAPADHSGDGRHLVEFRASDADGNVEEWKNATVSIDTRRPSTRTLHAVGVMRTATAKVGFRVDDGVPNGGSVEARIVISSWAGRDVETLTMDHQTIGTDLVARFRCDLPSWVLSPARRGPGLRGQCRDHRRPHSARRDGVEARSRVWRPNGGPRCPRLCVRDADPSRR